MWDIIEEEREVAVCSPSFAVMDEETAFLAMPLFNADVVPIAMLLLLFEPMPFSPPPPPLCANVLLRNEKWEEEELAVLALPEVEDDDPEVEDEKCDAEEWVWLVMAVSSRLSRRSIVDVEAAAAAPATSGWLLLLLLLLPILLLLLPLLLALRPPPRDGSKTRRRCFVASNDDDGGLLLLYDGIDVNVMALLLVLVDDVPSAIGSGPTLLTLFSLNDAAADDDDSPIII